MWDQRKIVDRVANQYGSRVFNPSPNRNPKKFALHQPRPCSPPLEQRKKRISQPSLWFRSAGLWSGILVYAFALSLSHHTYHLTARKIFCQAVDGIKVSEIGCLN
jgi:hypothetical protein